MLIQSLNLTDTIYCYLFDLKKAALVIDYLNSFLTDSDLTEIDRIKNVQRQTELRLSRAILRQKLSEHTGLNTSQLVFLKSNAGKPYLQNDLPWTFNLSHSDKYLFLALSEVFDLGVDIENLNKDHDFTLIKKYLFTEDDKKSLLALSNEDHQRRCLELWTLKEAQFKLLGPTRSGPLVNSHTQWIHQNLVLTVCWSEMKQKYPSVALREPMS